MKIVTIFADRLYAFHFKGEKFNELKRLLTLWNNTEYLYQFVTKNKAHLPKEVSLDALIFQLIQDANEIDEILQKISIHPKKKLESFFKPLDNKEYRTVQLSKQKGRKNYLRLYAIKIDSNCFVITGGAIKFHHLNKDEKHTQSEMDKIDKCRNFLKDNGVVDTESFYELLIEIQ